MRLAALAVVAILAGCAAQPGLSTNNSYKGVFVSGGAQIGTDGSFSSVAGVWNAADFARAQSVAVDRLVTQARAGGYVHVLVKEERTSQQFGIQYQIAGKLYRAGNAPQAAYPIGRIAEAIAHAGGPVLAAKTVAPAKRKSAPKAVEEPLPPADDEPLVIEAPDFITAVPSKRPLG
jgi:hypothetical protein